MSRRAAVLIAAAVLVGAAIAGGLALALHRGAPHKLTVAEYLARVHTACVPYSLELDKVPPPNSLLSATDVRRAVERALPIMQGEAKAVAAVDPPPSIAPRVEALNTLAARSNDALANALTAARAGNGAAMRRYYGAWLIASADSHAAATKLGFHCSS